VSSNRRLSLLTIAVLALGIVAASYFGFLGGPIRAAVTLPGWLVIIDCLQGYDYSRTPEWLYPVAGCVSAGFWFILMWPFLSKSPRNRRIAVTVAVLVLVPVIYLAFRTTEVRRDNREVYRFHRSWGFITRVTLDANDDGRIDDETWYSWRDPFLDAHNSRPQRSRSDRNLDGRWDTWVDYSTLQLQIDLDGDGVADHTLTADYDGFHEATQLRGY